jgi:calcium-dependent protein kinase
MSEEPDVLIHKENIISHKTSNITKEYTFGKVIGTGSYGQVRLAVHKLTKQVRAVKIIQKAKVNINALLNEINILSKLSHPNIMQIFEVFDDNTNVYIVSEYCKGGELFDIISTKGSFTEKDACVIMKQLMSAICYSHQNNIVHRDLKPENILMDNDTDDLTIKLIDWGCAQTIKSAKQSKQADGTAYYIAPEVLKGEYDEKCDIWACGVIFYILLCGYPPFNGETDDEIYEAILSGKFQFPEEDWDQVSQEAKDLIKKMLTKDPKKRISALDSMQDVWFKKNEEKSEYDKKLAKKVLNNMKKFKKHRILEKTIISFIINQLVKKDERLELEKQFKDWDTNGDGVLSKEEIINGYRKTYGKVDENEIENMIKSIDLDGNGVIDYNEFLACSINKDKILRNDNLKICFDEFDTDKSGKISVDEVSSIFKQGNNENNNDMEAFKNMVKNADENGDGEISFEEFQDIMNKFFM